MVKYTYGAWGKILAQRTLTTAYGMLASLNPFRYRGYVYDEETELYYLRSRYYNPDVGRFVNADTNLGNVSGLKTHNLYEYCYCAPTCFHDSNGNTAVKAAEFYKEASMVDGPLPIGDFIGIIGAVLIYFWGSLSNSQSISYTKANTNTKSEPTPSPTPTPSPHPSPEPSPTRKYHQEYFPENPLQFTPLGLLPTAYPPTANVPTIIKWTIPGTKIALFEWDYDITTGSHYHVMLPSMNNHHLEGNHYRAGEMVPEPWNSLFFGDQIDEPWSYLE